VSGEAKGPWEDHLLEDIQFHVRIKMKGEHWMDYEVHDIADEDSEGQKLFAFENEHGTDDLTPDIEKAIIFMHGAIKWDGCSHNNLQEYIHGCARKDMTRIGTLFEKLFDIACEKMPKSADEYLR
jgi:hypothetical protein